MIDQQPTDAWTVAEDTGCLLRGMIDIQTKAVRFCVDMIRTWADTTVIRLRGLHPMGSTGCYYKQVPGFWSREQTLCDALAGGIIWVHR